MKTKYLFIAMTLVVAVGCSQEAPPAPAAGAPSEAPSETTAPVATQVQAPIGDPTFSITPGSFRLCDADNGAITATAKWDVTAKNIAEVSVYVIDAKGERKLWLNGSATGESKTGNWVFPDSKFELVERGSEKLVADLTVRASPCN